MKKKIFLFFLVAVIGIAFMSIGAFKAEAQPIKLTYSNFFPPTHIQSKLAEADIMQAHYKELITQCEESKEQYDAIIEEAVEINEEDVEQAVFELVNQERKDNGLNELIWQEGLYSCARSNNLKMAETKTLQNPECPSFQQVFWFLGYGKTDRIANTALKIWKDNLYSYEQNVLSKAVYGAVAVYKPEEILYITYVAYVDFD